MHKRGRLTTHCVEWYGQKHAEKVVKNVDELVPETPQSLTSTVQEDEVCERAQTHVFVTLGGYRLVCLTASRCR